MVPGAVFGDYEPSDHRGMRRTLGELQEGHLLVLSRGDFCQSTGDNTKASGNSHREMQVGYCRLMTS